LDDDPDRWDPGWMLPGTRLVGRVVAWIVGIAIALIVLGVVAAVVMNALSPLRDTTSFGVGVVLALVAVGVVVLLVKSRKRT
jgi:hypothetical protein